MPQAKDINALADQIEPIIRYHETGGHEGSGSDEALARAREALSRLRTEPSTAAETVEPCEAEPSEAVEPAYMEWPALNELMHRRIMDNDYGDADIVATRAETRAMLGWASYFDRKAQPRRDEEERTYRIIKEAGALIEAKAALSPPPADDVELLLECREALNDAFLRSAVDFRTGSPVSKIAAMIARIDARLSTQGEGKQG